MAMADQQDQDQGILGRWLEGLDERDRQQAIGMGLVNLGGGLLSQSGPGGSIAQGFAQGAKSAMAVPDELRQQAMQRAAYQQKMAQQKAMQDALATLPEEQRTIAMMDPGAFAKARAERMFKTQDPMKVGYGEQVIDPTTGKVIAAGAEDPSKRFMTVGNVIYDRASMKPVYQAPQQVAPTELQRNLGAMGLKPGTPEYADAMRRGMGGGGGEFDRLTTAAGFAPGTPEYQEAARRKLAGKTEGLSATEKQEVFEAADTAFAASNARESLTRALALNEKAASGYFPLPLAKFTSVTGIGGKETANATIEYNNLIGEQVLSNLKATFGGNPTEGERAILFELQASADKTPEQRKPILERAISMAKKREDYNRQKAEEIRGGTYFSRKGTGQPQPVSSGLPDLPPGFKPVP